MKKTNVVPSRVLNLYIKLSAWLIPTFVICALVGLHLLSSHIVSDVEHRVSMRIGNLTGRIASGLERVSDEVYSDDVLRQISAEQIMLTLMSDPAIMCAELVRPGETAAMLEVPVGLGCHSGLIEKTTSLPVYFDGDADLNVSWSDGEVEAARQRQREISMVILVFGLLVALTTNWLAFRVIIGKPLNDLINRIEDARNKAEFNALHDSLTEIANRRHLDEVLEERFERARRYSDEVILLHIDLDGFKAINDTLGHAAGDFVLKHIANNLKALSTQGEFVARIGGDEFVMVLENNFGLKRAKELANQIIEMAGSPVDYQGDVCRLGASIGIACANHQNTSSTFSPDRILMDSDIALYSAKRGGRGKYAVFSPEMRKEVEHRKTLGDELVVALEKDEFFCHYQPQFDPTGQTILGLEALVRWQHPRHGVIYPGEFLSIAEELNIMDQIDLKVLQMAITDIPEFEARGLPIPKMSVNISSSLLRSPEFLTALNAMELPCDRLVFEVLETIFLEKMTETEKWNIDGIHELGIELEIDDFGTGHASISSVLSLGPARLKVAREIVNAFTEEQDQKPLLEAVAALGRALNVGLIAEGVETEKHMQSLNEMGFEKLQGFALCKPAAFDEIVEKFGKSNLIRAAQ